MVISRTSKGFILDFSPAPKHLAPQQIDSRGCASEMSKLVMRGELDNKDSKGQQHRALYDRDKSDNPRVPVDSQYIVKAYLKVVTSFVMGCLGGSRWLVLRLAWAEMRRRHYCGCIENVSASADR